jgi:hypothetical protein
MLAMVRMGRIFMVTVVAGVVGVVARVGLPLHKRCLLPRGKRDSLKWLNGARGKCRWTDNERTEDEREGS